MYCTLCIVRYVLLKNENVLYFNDDIMLELEINMVKNIRLFIRLYSCKSILFFVHARIKPYL